MNEARFYTPFSHTIKNLNLVAYPAKDENPLTDVYDTKAEITDYLDELYEKYNALCKLAVAIFCSCGT